jgi:hypothetical protein
MRSRLALVLAALPASFLLPSCGGGSGVSVPSPPTVSVTVSPPIATVKAGSEFFFHAKVSGSTNTAVTWQVNGISGGNSTLGTIDNAGLYTAPAFPPAPPSVNVTAVSTADASKSDSADVTVTINITVVPAIASLLISTPQCPVSQPFTAVVSGTSNPAVTWNLTGLPSGSGGPAFGTLSADGLYTAPSTIPSPPNFSVAATSQADPTQTAAASLTISAGGPIVDQIAQSGPIRLGTSGGNSADKTQNFCCSGTLGALVTRNGDEFILSNNHVLARKDQALPGEGITQPGLVDNRCTAGRVIATFTQAAQLKNAGNSASADAALAKIVAGGVDDTGAILQLGAVSCGRAQPAPPASSIASASVGMNVAKSGRTTGLTCGTIGAVSVDGVKVDYQTSCGSGSTFTVTFNNQIIVDTPTFSDAGDSGSLIVDADTAEPTGLLFAGDSGSGITVANPIQDALASLADPSNQAVPTIVGGNTHPVAACSQNGSPQAMARPGISALSRSALARARRVKHAHLSELLSHPGVLGVGIGAGAGPHEAAIVIFMQRGQSAQEIPASLDHVNTRIRTIGRLHALGANFCAAAAKVQSNLTVLR